MKIKIVADSSADTLEFEGVEFASVPLVIATDAKSYIDDKNLDVEGMISDLSNYKGRSRTSCPSTGEWLKAFDGADVIYVLTITSKLSGSYNSAMVAKEMFLEDNPNAKVHVFDTLSTGPEMRLLIEKLNELISEGLAFEEVVTKANDYLESTKLYFSLESLHNLAQNGRVSKFSEIAAKVLNIKIIGQAHEGVLQLRSKCRGMKKALSTFMEYFFEHYNAGKVRIAHANNLKFAEMIKEAILEKFKDANILIYRLRGLCSFYAEEGGVLVGFETK